MGANPLGVDSKWRVYQQRAEESCQRFADLGFSTGVEGPVQCGGIVRDIEEDRVWVIGDVGGSNDVEGCNVVDDDCYEFEDVDGYQCTVLVVLHMEKCTTLDFLGE